MAFNSKILKDKNAVITGCLQGIGRATLDMFAANGANVWACAQYPTDEFESRCAELSKTCNVWIKPIYFDLLNQEQIKEGLRTIAADKKPIDSLVNIAGMTKDSLFHMLSIDLMKTIFEVNFFSQMVITQFITKLMLRNGKGSVINISSISAIDGNAGQLAYSASKAAIIGATKTLSAELAPRGIRVNAVAPGVIDTEMNKIVPQDVIAKHLSNTSLSRMGEANEVASTIVFLASDLSAYMTGQIIRIDGGIK